MHLYPVNLTKYQIEKIIKHMPNLLCISLCSLVLFGVQFSSAEEVAPQTEKFLAEKTLVAPVNTKIPSALVNFFTSQYYSPYVFLVDKKARELSVWEMQSNSLKKVATYPADLGKNDGEKRERNDQKTPSGIYFLERRLEGNGLDHKLYGERAFTTNYPNYFDRLEGKGGSGIWFHAVPDTVALTRGSRGCVVVRNEVIKEVTQYIKLQKTPIIIQDELELSTPEDMKKISDASTQMIENWRSSWQAKNIDNYITFYDDDFKSNGMDVKRWKTFKGALNQTYKEIKVNFSKPMIFAYKNYAIARFLQAYRSDQHEDFGEKLIYLVKRGDTYKILGEEWVNEPDEVAKTEVITSTTADSTSASSR